MLGGRVSEDSTAAPPVTEPAEVPPGTRPILECRGIYKRFGAVEVLHDVDFEVYPGEVVALVGDNGAGKSTLIKAIAGTHPADAGTIMFEGKEVSIARPADATALGIETVYQDLAICDNLDVVQNMFLGREKTSSPGFVPPPLRNVNDAEMERVALGVLQRLHVGTIHDLRMLVRDLSGGQRQSVAISRAVMWNSKVVILDEPTAALGVAQTEEVLDLIRELRAQGLGVVVITHNIDVVFDVADRIVVLRLGRCVGTFRTKDSTRTEIVSAILGVSPDTPRGA